MDDWIKAAAEKAISRRAQAAHEQALKEQPKPDFLGLWDSLVERLSKAVSEFNGHQELNGSVRFDRPDPKLVGISLGAGKASVTLFYKGEEGLQVHIRMSRKRVDSGDFNLGWDTTDSGELCLVRDGEPLSQEKLVKILLEPLFNRVE